MNVDVNNQYICSSSVNHIIVIHIVNYTSEEENRFYQTEGCIFCSHYIVLTAAFAIHGPVGEFLFLVSHVTCYKHDNLSSCKI